VVLVFLLHNQQKLRSSSAGNMTANPGEIWHRNPGALEEKRTVTPAGNGVPFAIMSATLVSGLRRPEKVMILGVDSISVDGTVFYDCLNLKTNKKLNLDFPQLEKHYTLIYSPETKETVT
jgi:hypothetical protein